ncbi:MAG TPA: transglycosylase [Pseudolabrys sp.]|nr:transglycosylase [Pseudolabrys sp.]
MRTSWWACLCVGVMTCSAGFILAKRSMPAGTVEASAPSEWRDIGPQPAPSVTEASVSIKDKDQAPSLSIKDKDPEPSRAIALAPYGSQPEAAPDAAKDAKAMFLADAAATGSIKPLELSDVKPAPPLIDKAQARLPGLAPAPAAVQPAPPEPAPAPVKEARLEPATAPLPPSEINAPTQDLSLLTYYAYSEMPPAVKPAETVLNALKDIPRGSVMDEIRLIANTLHLDFTFMKTIAKIESDFDPKQRTGSYIGLYQLSKHEFELYGSGNILDARDNAVAAAFKFKTEAILFEIFMHRKTTLNDVYLIHQQGVDGAEEHVSHPQRLAWKSMCATDEGREKGEKWCKRAIWGNTLPAIKRVWKNVNNVTSAAFVSMWQQRVAQFYARYSAATPN